MSARFSRPRLLVATAVTALVVAVAGPAIALLPGSDVASHQHPGSSTIDWSRVKAAGHAFAIVKATEGTSYVNPHFAEDSYAMQRAGIVRGTYHYARPEFPAILQAEHYARVIATHPTRLDLPPVLDIEETGGLPPLMLQAWVRTFLTTLDKLTGRTAIIYTSPGFWRYQMANSADFADRPLWIADYNGGNQPTMPLPGGWTHWTFWQYTGNGRVDGVNTPIDLNTFNGDHAQLLALTRHNDPNARITAPKGSRKAKKQQLAPAKPAQIPQLTPEQIAEIQRRLSRSLPPDLNTHLNREIAKHTKKATSQR